MNQYDFDQLAQKYLSGECTPAEEELLHQWSETLLTHSDRALNPTEKKRIKRRIWHRLLTTVGQRPRSLNGSRWLGIGLAASIGLVLIGLAYFSRQRPIRHDQGRQLAGAPGAIEVHNTSGSAQKMTLEDGSLVVLKGKSSLSYPEHFGDKARHVFLRGEAFFHVKRDPSKPFIVHTGDLVTQVLGTSFTVKSYEGAQSIEVQVATGRVSVYEASEKSPHNRNGVILTPNQQIVFDKASRKLIPGLIDSPVVLPTAENKAQFAFTEMPLPQVLAALRAAYGIEIVLENEALNGCIFNGDLTDLPLYTQLDLICKSIDAAYERRGTTLFIQGEGCSGPTLPSQSQ